MDLNFWTIQLVFRSKHLRETNQFIQPVKEMSQTFAYDLHKQRITYIRTEHDAFEPIWQEVWSLVRNIK